MNTTYKSTTDYGTTFNSQTQQKKRYEKLYELSKVKQQALEILR